MGLPYDMGNAGDLLKHGVLAEFVRWRCERGASFRFIDLFGGEPWERVNPEVANRVRALPEDVALRMAQIEIEKDPCRYYGSGRLVKNIAKQVGEGDVCVLTDDRCKEKRTRLKEAGLTLLRESEEFSISDADDYDAYKAFEKIIPQLGENDRKNDLVLIDPFDDFLNPNKGEHYKEVIPQIKETIEQGAAVILFALNKNPCEPDGRKFEALLRKHLPRTWRWRATMPPLRYVGLRGESNYHAEVVLAARALETDPDAVELKKRLEKLEEHLAILPAQLLKPQAVCKMK